MKYNQIFLLLLTSSLLVACGDSNSPAPDPTQPPQSQYDYLDVKMKPTAPKSGTVTVMLGEFDNKITQWILDNPTADLNKDGGVGLLDAHLAGVYNDDKEGIEVDLSDMADFLATNPDGLGAGTARPDIFKPGHFSAFDLLRYLSGGRDDLELSGITNYDTTGLGTYTFNVSFDADQSGIFDPGTEEADNGNWHFRFNAHGGDFNRARGNMQGFSPSGEANYIRMDEYWLQDGSLITFQSFSDEMTARRQWVQRQEVLNFEANGNEPVVPSMTALTFDADWNPSVQAQAKDVKITAHNHRDDIFQPGVVTVMDAMISAQEQLNGVSFSYWDTLSTGAKVGHWAVSGIGGKRNSGLYGWFSEFHNPANKPGDPDFSKFPNCNWGIDGSQDGEPRVSQEVCQRDWAGAFGGELVHMLPDVYPMNYGYNNFSYVYGSMYDIFGPTKRDINNSLVWEYKAGEQLDKVTFQTFELPSSPVGNAPLLDEAHFGWQIADCTLCHNELKEPLGHGGHSWPINSRDGFSQSQPYYCASCHGANGAPKAHGEDDRCFFCHAGDKLPKKHGDASTKVLYQGADNMMGNKMYGFNPKYRGVPADEFGNHKPIEQRWNSRNNDWDISRVFPDPYACMTCHQQPE